MSIWYKEHDHDAYVYKYANCWVIVENNDGERRQVYVHEIKGNGTVWNVAYLTGTPSIHTIDVVHEWHPIYHHVESKFYPTQKDSVLALVKKKLVKCFLVGIGSKNYSTSLLGKGVKDAQGSLYPLFLKEPKINVNQALEEGGLIGDRFMITKDEVFYTDLVIGMRKKKNFLVNGHFKSEIEDCLRGHECLITV
jgi:hypothetical protein